MLRLVMQLQHNNQKITNCIQLYNFLEFLQRIHVENEKNQEMRSRELSFGFIFMLVTG